VILLPLPPTQLGLQTGATMPGSLVEIEVLLTFALLAFNCDPLDLYFSSTWDYRHKPLFPALSFFMKIFQHETHYDVTLFLLTHHTTTALLIKMTHFPFVN
jgi:hypothetical protein